MSSVELSDIPTAEEMALAERRLLTAGPDVTTAMVKIVHDTWGAVLVSMAESGMSVDDLLGTAFATGLHIGLEIAEMRAQRERGVW